MKGEVTDSTEKSVSTPMSEFFRSVSVEERRAVYRAAVKTAIGMQNAVISLARDKKTQASSGD
ncbi:MAG: hypothetical protein GAK37_01409 [Pseudomonas sp.]|nr:MAG: hypothetical protein GAK37_01409 [Pseudomonas sp.]